ncbi:MAG: glycerol-3-phosphate dehydrogenase, partial [Spirochaetales bacterium]|nr:glycerol-3-phosphate dehydrogenase [Spirochaetales bacterium]
YGRNRRFGREIVNDNKISSFKNIDDLIKNISSIGYLPEGAVAARSVQLLAERLKLKLPICENVYKILNKEEQPLESVQELIKNLNLSAT